MKLRVLNIITSLFVTACIITSCLGDDTINYEYSSNASINAFSITDSIVTHYKASVNGKDTTLSKSVVGSKYPFIINQNDGLIYNADSLPVGTDISKVVVSITADTYGIFIVAENDSLWEETDSLDFTKPIQFKVLAESGVWGRTYTAKINVHQQEADSMSWGKVACNFDSTIKRQKAVYANKNIYVFAEQDAQVAMTATQSSNGQAWSALETIDIPVKADYSSAMFWGDRFYILADNQLYASANGINWNKVETEQAISRLHANVHTPVCQKLIGTDMEGYYIESEDGTNWVRHELLPEAFPQGQTAFVSYPLATNDNFNRLVIMGQNELSTDTATVTWTQLNDEHEWISFGGDENNTTCPKLENQALIHYNGQLYTFGGPGQHKGAIPAFGYFYHSKDNGINWKQITKKIMFPKEFEGLYHKAEGNYSYIVDEEQFIWIMWSQTGEVWRGRINKFGFDKQ